MNTSITNWSFHRTIAEGKMDVPKFVAEAKRLGFRAVELLSAWTSTPEQIKQAKSAASDAGLRICCYGASNDFALTGDELDKQVSDLKAKIANAVELGAPVVRVFGGNTKEGLTVEKGLGLIVDGFRKAIKDAEDAKVTLAIENHGRLSCTSDQVGRILREVGSPALKATFDCGNFMIGDENPIDAVKSLAKLTGHVHVKDLRWDNVTAEPPQVYVSNAGKKLLPEVIGEGQIDFVTIFRALREAGFRGYLSLEYEGNDPEPEGVYTSAHNLFKFAALAERAS